MKKLSMRSVQKRTVRLFDFSGGINSNVDPALYQDKFFDYSVNFDCSKKSLVDGHGLGLVSFDFSGSVKTCPTPPTNSNFLKGYFFKLYDGVNEKFDDRVLFYNTDGYMYELKIYADELSFSKLEDLHFDKAPQSVCYKLGGDDVIIFGSGDGLKIYDGTQVISVDDAPQITSMCLHGERLFITCDGEKSTLFFSDDFDPLNWSVSLTEAGFIDFQDGLGSLVKVISFNDYVYVFRRYGITKIYAYGDQSEFYASTVLSGCPQIKDNCVFVCGDRIIYLTDNGFYSFNGSYSVKILSGIDGFIDVKKGGAGAYFNGELFFHSCFNVGDISQYYTLVYNVEKGRFYLMDGCGINDIVAINSESVSKLIFTLTGGKVATLTDGAKMLDEPMTKIIRTAFGDFDISREKTLAYVSLYSDKDLWLTVTTDYGSKTIGVSGSDRRIKIPIGMRCQSLSIMIKCSVPKATIRKVECEFLVG